VKRRDGLGVSVEALSRSRTRLSKDPDFWALSRVVLSAHGRGVLVVQHTRIGQDTSEWRWSEPDGTVVSHH
jgi:hypothetical protein